jgi:hypothetical protein
MTSFHKGLLIGLLVGAGGYHLYASKMMGGGGA